VAYWHVWFVIYVTHRCHFIQLASIEKEWYYYARPMTFPNHKCNHISRAATVNTTIAACCLIPKDLCIGILLYLVEVETKRVGHAFVPVFKTCLLIITVAKPPSFYRIVKTITITVLRPFNHLFWFHSHLMITWVGRVLGSRKVV